MTSPFAAQPRRTGTFRDMFNHKKPYERPLDDDHYTITLRAFKSSSSVEFEFLETASVACRVNDLDNTTPLRRRARNLLATILGGETQITDGANYMSGAQDFSINAKEGFYLLYAWGTSGTHAQHAANVARCLRPPVGRAGEHFSRRRTSTSSQKSRRRCRWAIRITRVRNMTWARLQIRDGGSHQRQSHAFASRAVLRLHGWNERPERRLLRLVTATRPRQRPRISSMAAVAGDGSIAKVLTLSAHGNMDLKCAEVLVSWAVGGNRVVLPDGTGRTFGGSGPDAIRYDHARKTLEHERRL